MKIKKKLPLFLSALVFTAILLASCQPLTTLTPPDSLVQTSAAQTLAAKMTPTTMQQTQQDPTQTPTAESTPTPTQDNSQNGAAYCDWANVAEHMTISDSEVVDPDQSFTKTWLLENIGSCTWTTSYQIVFSSGYAMDAQTSMALPKQVQPGETVEISLDMIAPSEPGIYTGYWLLVNENGDTFGIGQDAETPFWVRIRVTEEDKALVYSLAENTCSAGWESSVQQDIACPSNEYTQNGFVQPLNQVQMENGETYSMPAILTYPDYGRSGYMVGLFPTLEIQKGDHFKATIGCQYGANDCSVNFTLRVAMAGEGMDNLGAWWEIYDGKVYPIDVDLSDYAGMEVDIVLSAIAATDNNENYAIWLDPRVVHDTGEPDQTYNQARFVEDVTVEDRSLMNPGEEFTKIWRFENVGESTWTTDYQVVFSSGYQMGAPDAVNLPQTVAPGETVDISLDMVAPSSPGVYTGYWMLMDENNHTFGVGEENDAPFWVRIKVTGQEENVLYNFAENTCEAGWESSVDPNITCPSEQNFEQGFVQPIDMPKLEDGNTYNEPAILAYPDQGKSGYMVGRFPGYVVQEGDHFKATIGCQYGAENCNVRYTLRIIRTGEGYDRLGMWHEVYEGLLYPIDVDLSDFAGQNVEIVLSVIAADDTGQNFALWLDPRIVREAN